MNFQEAPCLCQYSARDLHLTFFLLVLSLWYRGHRLHSVEPEDASFSTANAYETVAGAALAFIQGQKKFWRGRTQKGLFQLQWVARLYIKADNWEALAYFLEMCLWPCWANSLDRSHRWRIKCLCHGDSHTRTSAQRLIPCMMMLPLRTHKGSNPIFKVQWTRTNIEEGESGMFSTEASFCTNFIIFSVFGSFISFLHFRWCVNPHLLFPSRVSYLKEAATTSHKDMCLLMKPPRTSNDVSIWFSWSESEGRGGGAVCKWLKLLFFFH